MQTPVTNFMRVFSTINKDNIEIVEQMYEENIEFHDPIHNVKGIEDVKNYFRSLYEGVTSCDVAYGDIIEQEGCATICWVMTMSHKKLNSGRPFDVTGLSHLKFNDKIYYHHDYFDVGEMVYEQITLVGAIVRFVKRRLQS